MDGELLDLFPDGLRLPDAVFGQYAPDLLPEGAEIGVHMGKGRLGLGCIGVHRADRDGG